MPNFSDVEIEKIFGADDAENETDGRFLEYFYVNRAYESLCSGLPIRILVGHKGVGKSALLKRAYLEQKKLKALPIWLRPNEITSSISLSANSADFNTRVEAWKLGILQYTANYLVNHYYGQKLIKTAPETKDANIVDLVRIVKRCREDTLSNKDALSTTIYIDDIDRGWSASKNDITNISALLNAIRDLASPAINSGIAFRIGLRSDVYYLVRTSDESTDKIERNVIWLQWSNDEILRVIAMRI